VRAGTNGFDARAYEVAVLVHLRDRLRAGDMWVEGSRAYRTFDDYLLPRPTFTLMRAEGRLGLAVPDDFAAWRAERAALLDLKLNALSVAATKNQLPEAAITADGLTISPIRREEREQARALSSRLYNLMPRVRITDLLAEVNVWTAFANHFTHYRTGEPAATDEPALMGAILADATNLGLDRMAESSSTCLPRGFGLRRLVDLPMAWQASFDRRLDDIRRKESERHDHPDRTLGLSLSRSERL